MGPPPTTPSGACRFGSPTTSSSTARSPISAIFPAALSQARLRRLSFFAPSSKRRKPGRISIFMAGTHRQNRGARKAARCKRHACFSISSNNASASLPNPCEDDAAMQAFDRRLTPARPDLAAQELAGCVLAERYVAGRTMHVNVEVADLRNAPSHDSSIDTQALFGENLTLYEDHE